MSPSCILTLTRYASLLQPSEPCPCFVLSPCHVATHTSRSIWARIEKAALIFESLGCAPGHAFTTPNAQAEKISWGDIEGLQALMDLGLATGDRRAGGRCAGSGGVQAEHSRQHTRGELLHIHKSGRPGMPLSCHSTPCPSATMPCLCWISIWLSQGRLALVLVDAAITSYCPVNHMPFPAQF